MQRTSVSYIVGFAAAVCLGCSLLVSTTAVVLKDRQVANQLYSKQTKILAVAGLIEDGSKPPTELVTELFENRIETVIVNMETSIPATDSGIEDALRYEQQKAAKDPARSFKVDSNPAKVARLPKYIPIYIINNEAGEMDNIVLPVEGMGLWGTLYGFVSVDADLQTIRGLTFYQHKETPGLGAEVDNPTWKEKWDGRKIYGEDGDPQIQVIKGPAGTPEETPYKVDGLSGATITSNGVTNLLRFWLGDDGFGEYLDSLDAEGSEA